MPNRRHSVFAFTTFHKSMNDKVPSHGLVLYIWPGQWDLPSSEPLCLAAVLYLQLAIPNKFRLVETANPDSSPSGMPLARLIEPSTDRKSARTAAVPRP